MPTARARSFVKRATWQETQSTESAPLRVCDARDRVDRGRDLGRRQRRPLRAGVAASNGEKGGPSLGGRGGFDVAETVGIAEDGPGPDASPARTNAAASRDRRRVRREPS